MVHHGARGRNLAADQPPELHGNGLAVWQTPGPAPTNVPAKVYGRQISPIRRVRAQDLAVLRRALRQHRHPPVGDISVAWQQSTARWPIQARFGP